jgi:hypothetical protein
MSKQVTLTRGKPAQLLTKREGVKAGEDFVQEMMYRIAAPFLCWPGYEHDVTQEMIEHARLARLARFGPIDHECTDYEAAMYLSQASLVAPLDRTWAKIYIHVFTGALPEKAKLLWGEDGAPEPLEEWEVSQLHRFKQWIYKKQIEHMKQHEKRTIDEPAGITANLESFVK